MLALVKLRRIWWFEVFFNILSWNNCVRGAPSHQDSSSGNQKYLSKIEWESNSCGHKSANWQPLTKKKKNQTKNYWVFWVLSRSPIVFWFWFGNRPGVQISQCVLLQMEKPIICTANQNGSQADCELGNPFKRDSEVPTCPNFHVFILTLSCCASNVRHVLTFF